jgi:hypothetical protein
MFGMFSISVQASENKRRRRLRLAGKRTSEHENVSSPLEPVACSAS